MDLTKISLDTSKQLSSFVENILYFFRDPLLRFEPKVVKKKEKFNPSLFYYALICISLGTALQASIPSMKDPVPSEKLVAITVILTLWIANALLITLPARWLGKEFNFKRILSMVIQVLASLYFVSSILAFLSWVIFSKTGSPFGFSDYTMSIWYYPYHLILSLIYLPWGIIKIIKIKRLERIFLVSIIWILIFIFEGLSLTIWSLLHFAGYG